MSDDSHAARIAAQLRMLDSAEDGNGEADDDVDGEEGAQ